jgi:hypothetical protein
VDCWAVVPALAVAMLRKADMLTQVPQLKAGQVLEIQPTHMLAATTKLKIWPTVHTTQKPNKLTDYPIAFPLNTLFL